MKQRYEQLVQAEANGRAITKAKLDKFRAHRDREVHGIDSIVLSLCCCCCFLSLHVEVAFLAFLVWLGVVLFLTHRER